MDTGMKNKRKAASAVSAGMPGAATLMIIFTVLCMSVLAVLTLSRAVSDNRLAKRSFENVKAYYEACNDAERQLAVLSGSGETGETEVTSPVSDTAGLRISADITPEGVSVTGRQTVYTGQWENDETLELWTGD